LVNKNSLKKYKNTHKKHTKNTQDYTQNTLIKTLNNMKGLLTEALIISETVHNETIAVLLNLVNPRH